jgi:hypothetical protein
MEEARENGKESSHSAHANGMNECVVCVVLGICVEIHPMMTEDLLFHFLHILI